MNKATLFIDESGKSSLSDLIEIIKFFGIDKGEVHKYLKII